MAEWPTFLLLLLSDVNIFQFDVEVFGAQSSLCCAILDHSLGASVLNLAVTKSLSPREDSRWLVENKKSRVGGRDSGVAAVADGGGEDGRG
jgi:hypothetical protein